MCKAIEETALVLVGNDASVAINREVRGARHCYDQSISAFTDALIWTAYH